MTTKAKIFPRLANDLIGIEFDESGTELVKRLRQHRNLPDKPKRIFAINSNNESLQCKSFTVNRQDFESKENMVEGQEQEEIALPTSQRSATFCFDPQVASTPMPLKQNNSALKKLALSSHQNDKDAIEENDVQTVSDDANKQNIDPETDTDESVSNASINVEVAAISQSQAQKRLVNKTKTPSSGDPKVSNVATTPTNPKGQTSCHEASPKRKSTTPVAIVNKSIVGNKTTETGAQTSNKSLIAVNTTEAGAQTSKSPAHPDQDLTFKDTQTSACQRSNKSTTSPQTSPIKQRNTSRQCQTSPDEYLHPGFTNSPPSPLLAAPVLPEHVNNSIPKGRTIPRTPTKRVITPAHPVKSPYVKMHRISTFSKQIFTPPPLFANTQPIEIPETQSPSKIPSSQMVERTPKLVTRKSSLVRTKSHLAADQFPSTPKSATSVQRRTITQNRKIASTSKHQSFVERMEEEPVLPSTSGIKSKGAAATQNVVEMTPKEVFVSLVRNSVIDNMEPEEEVLLDNLCTEVRESLPMKPVNGIVAKRKLSLANARNSRSLSRESILSECSVNLDIIRNRALTNNPPTANATTIDILGSFEDESFLDEDKWLFLNSEWARMEKMARKKPTLGEALLSGAAGVKFRETSSKLPRIPYGRPKVPTRIADIKNRKSRKLYTKGFTPDKTISELTLQTKTISKNYTQPKTTTGPSDKNRKRILTRNESSDSDDSFIPNITSNRRKEYSNLKKRESVRLKKSRKSDKSNSAEEVEKMDTLASNRISVQQQAPQSSTSHNEREEDEQMDTLASNRISVQQQAPQSSTAHDEGEEEEQMDTLATRGISVQQPQSSTMNDPVTANNVNNLCPWVSMSQEPISLIDTIFLNASNKNQEVVKFENAVELHPSNLMHYKLHNDNVYTEYDDRKAGCTGFIMMKPGGVQAPAKLDFRLNYVVLNGHVRFSVRSHVGNDVLVDAVAGSLVRLNAQVIYTITNNPDFPSTLLFMRRVSESKSGGN